MTSGYEYNADEHQVDNRDTRESIRAAQAEASWWEWIEQQQYLTDALRIESNLAATNDPMRNELMHWEYDYVQWEDYHNSLYEFYSLRKR